MKTIFNQSRIDSILIWSHGMQYFHNILNDIRNNKNLNIAVPSSIDEALLRYIEYQERYSKRPDKIKHIQFIQDKIASNKIDLNKMFDKLHYYTSIPSLTHTSEK